MRRIEVDGEVFEELKKRAEPFVDTSPNDVLRKILGLRSKDLPKRRGRGGSETRPGGLFRSTDHFVRHVIQEEFGGGFHRRPPYRMMYQNATDIVYFQNFNKPGSDKLWYRIKRRPLGELQADHRGAHIVFTNPAEAIAYLVPVPDILDGMKKAGWDRDDLEVNIDPATSRWRQLDWDLSRYLRRYRPQK